MYVSKTALIQNHSLKIEKPTTQHNLSLILCRIKIPYSRIKENINVWNTSFEKFFGIIFFLLKTKQSTCYCILWRIVEDSPSVWQNFVYKILQNALQARIAKKYLLRWSNSQT